MTLMIFIVFIVFIVFMVFLVFIVFDTLDLHCLHSLHCLLCLLCFNGFRICDQLMDLQSCYDARYATASKMVTWIWVWCYSIFSWVFDLWYSIEPIKLSFNWMQILLSQIFLTIPCYCTAWPGPALSKYSLKISTTISFMPCQTQSQDISYGFIKCCISSLFKMMIPTLYSWEQFQW